MKSNPSPTQVASKGRKTLYFTGGAILLIAVPCAYWILAKPTSPPAIARKAPVAANAGPRHQTSATDKPSSAAAPPAARPSHIPPGASEPQKSFLSERDRLHADRMKLQAQLAKASPEERHQAMQKWHTDNAAALAAQQKLAQQMSAESAPRSFPIPPEPRIPENATPEMREFLSARHALMKERAEMMAKLKDASPEERQQAMQKWHTENAERLRAIRPPTSSPPTQQAH